MREKGRKASGLSRSRCCRGSGGRGNSVIYRHQAASLSAVGYPLLERVFVTSAQCARAFEILLKSSPRNNTSYLPRDIRFCRSRIDTRQLRFDISLDHQGESNLTTDSQVCFGLEAQYRVVFHLSPFLFRTPTASAVKERRELAPRQLVARQGTYGGYFRAAAFRISVNRSREPLQPLHRWQIHIIRIYPCQYRSSGTTKPRSQCSGLASVKMGSPMRDVLFIFMDDVNGSIRGPSIHNDILQIWIILIQHR